MIYNPTYDYLWVEPHHSRVHLGDESLSETARAALAVARAGGPAGITLHKSAAGPASVIGVGIRDGRGRYHGATACGLPASVSLAHTSELRDAHIFYVHP